MKNEINRRRRPRITLNWPIWMRLGTELAEGFPADLVNMSCTGAYCLSSVAMDIGQAVTLDILLPSELCGDERELTLQCKAVVVHYEPVAPGRHGVGISFRQYVLLRTPDQKIERHYWRSIRIAGLGDTAEEDEAAPREGTHVS